MAAALAEVKPLNAAGGAGLRFTFPNTSGGVESIRLDGFRFNGAALPSAGALRVRRLGPGATEVTASAPATGEWEFAVRAA